MTKKIRIGLIFGGQSAEHDVSLESGKNVMDALDPNKYEVHLIGIDKKGTWRYFSSREILARTELSKAIDVEQAGPAVFLAPSADGAQIIELASRQTRGYVDCVFPILHGPYGEDGTMQGFLRMLGIPFVGSGVLGSAVGMDKEFTKRLLKEAGLPVGKFLTLKRQDKSNYTFDKIKKELGAPFFLKPANMGSSVGVHKVTDVSSYDRAVNDAFQYDHKLLAEEFVPGREIEVAVLGNQNVRATTPGEIIPTHDFYSYDAKYLDENGARLEIPAKLNQSQVEEFKRLACEVFTTLGCEGLSRVDFFLTQTGQVYVNEINTIPGFTRISMYPKMWNNNGIGYSELIDQLIVLARERFELEQSLKR